MDFHRIEIVHAVKNSVERDLIHCNTDIEVVIVYRSNFERFLRLETDFKFKSACVSKTKPELKGLPSSYGESDTLTVVLEDTALGAELHLYYTAFEKCNVITRSTRLVNKSSRDIKRILFTNK